MSKDKNNSSFEEETRSTSRKLTSITAIIIYFIAGLLLLIWPGLMVEITKWGLIIVLAVYGIIKIISYFRMTPEDGANTIAFAGALLAFSLAIYILIDAASFAEIFPRVWGLIILLGGFMKIQDSIDTLRLHAKGWWIMLIGAVISLVLGIIAVIRPEFILNSIALFLGISLIVEAIIDLIILIIMRKSLKEIENA